MDDWKLLKIVGIGRIIQIYKWSFDTRKDGDKFTVEPYEINEMEIIRTFPIN